MEELNIISYDGGKLITKSKVILIIGTKRTGMSIIASNFILDNVIKSYNTPNK